MFLFLSIHSAYTFTVHPLGMPYLEISPIVANGAYSKESRIVALDDHAKRAGKKTHKVTGTLAKIGESF